VKLVSRSKPTPGAKPARCIITPELTAHVFATILGLIGMGYRILYFLLMASYIEKHGEDQPWPPPYTPSIPFAVAQLHTSFYCFAFASLVTGLRFCIYYSVLSSQLFIIRLTLTRATFKLLPAALFVIAAMMAFAIYGNQLYQGTSSEFQNLPSSIGTVLYLLRRPVALPFETMDRSALVWPLSLDQPSPLVILFIVGFTCTTLWIMANLYKAVIINEYTTVVRLYHGKQPPDLADDPWPSLNPFHVYRERRKMLQEYNYRKRIAAREKAEERSGLEEQKLKQKQLMARVSLELRGVEIDDSKDKGSGGNSKGKDSGGNSKGVAGTLGSVRKAVALPGSRDPKQEQSQPAARKLGGRV